MREKIVNAYIDPEGGEISPEVQALQSFITKKLSRGLQSTMAYRDYKKLFGGLICHDPMFRRRAAALVLVDALGMLQNLAAADKDLPEGTAEQLRAACKEPSMLKFGRYLELASSDILLLARTNRKHLPELSDVIDRANTSLKREIDREKVQTKLFAMAKEIIEGYKPQNRLLQRFHAREINALRNAAFLHTLPESFWIDPDADELYQRQVLAEFLKSLPGRLKNMQYRARGLLPPLAATKFLGIIKNDLEEFERYLVLAAEEVTKTFGPDNDRFYEASGIVQLVLAQMENEFCQKLHLSKEELHKRREKYDDKAAAAPAPEQAAPAP